MSSALNATQFDREIAYYGLFQNGYIFNILKDQKPTVHQQQSLIHSTGAELMKVYAIASFTMIKEVNRVSYKDKELNKSVVDRPNAFNYRGEKYNKPIKVEFTPNVEVFRTEEMTTSIFCNPEGGLLDIPDKIPSSEKIQIAILLHADIVTATFHVEFNLLPEASPYRSQAKIG